MSQAYEFLRECGVFFVATVDENQCPQARPFGAVMELEGKLYISTATGKAVYRQMRGHARVQLTALKPGSRDWIRINARAEEEIEGTVKARMLEECPALTRHFQTADCPDFAVFRLEEVDSTLHTDQGVRIL